MSEDAITAHPTSAATANRFGDARFMVELLRKTLVDASRTRWRGVVSPP
jgi:hypothetical protein